MRKTFEAALSDLIAEYADNDRAAIADALETQMMAVREADGDDPTPAMIEAGVRMHLTLRGGPPETLVHDIWQSMYHAWLAGEQ